MAPQKGDGRILKPHLQGTSHLSKGLVVSIGLDDKVILVTGASRGIGAAVTRALADQGARLIINYVHNKDRAQEVLKHIEGAGGKGMIVQADVRDSDAVRNMVDKAIDTYGRIDVMVNNANISFPIRPFVDLSWEDVQAKLVGELKALYNCSQAVLTDMKKRRSGKLIFVSSGLSRHPGHGFSAHAAAKSAVDGMAKVMALELGPLGITVNVVAPGLVLTDATSGLPAQVHEQTAAATPLRRIGHPDDIAATVVFLASSLSDYVTGEYIPVNGGAFMV